LFYEQSVIAQLSRSADARNLSHSFRTGFGAVSRFGEVPLNALISFNGEGQPPIAHSSHLYSARRANDFEDYRRRRPISLDRIRVTPRGARRPIRLVWHNTTAGANLVCDVAFRRAGMLPVKEVGELFGAVATLSTGIQVKSAIASAQPPASRALLAAQHRLEAPFHQLIDARVCSDVR
jgi:hypothetical protein